MKPDIKLFKRCMGKCATGVAIVTTLAPDNKKIGVTVNSLNSVSLDPFLILFSLKRISHFYSYFIQSKHCTVNILSTKQSYLSRLFAKPLEENWLEVETSQDTITTSPAIIGCITFLECEIYNQYDGGDHTIFIGKVVNLVEQNQDSPLLYFASEYRALDFNKKIDCTKKL